MKTDESLTSNSMFNESTRSLIPDEDHTTVKRVLQGSVNDFRLLVEKYQIPVFNLFLRMLHDRNDAEEMTQAVFVQAYEALPAFRFEYRFFSWLYRIAVNHALNHLKIQRKFVGLDQIINKPDEINDTNPDKTEQIKLAVNQLKDPYKQVIILKYYQQLSYKEVAFVLEITEKKVRSRLYDARFQLKNTLEKTKFFWD